MRVRFLTPALDELREAIQYYSGESPHQAARFSHEVEIAVGLIQFAPEAWTKIGRETRRCLLKTFPYALIYAVEHEEIVVTSVAHLKRDPEHYRDRIR